MRHHPTHTDAKALARAIEGFTIATRDGLNDIVSRAEQLQNNFVNLGMATTQWPPVDAQVIVEAAKELAADGIMLTNDIIAIARNIIPEEVTLSEDD